MTTGYRGALVPEKPGVQSESAPAVIEPPAGVLVPDRGVLPYPLVEAIDDARSGRRVVHRRENR